MPCPMFMCVSTGGLVEYEDLPSLVVQRPMQVHYKGDETVPSELATLNDNGCLIRTTH